MQTFGGLTAKENVLAVTEWSSDRRDLFDRGIWAGPDVHDVRILFFAQGAIAFAVAYFCYQLYEFGLPIVPAFDFVSICVCAPDGTGARSATYCPAWRERPSMDQLLGSGQCPDAIYRALLLSEHRGLHSRIRPDCAPDGASANSLADPHQAENTHSADLLRRALETPGFTGHRVGQVLRDHWAALRGAVRPRLCIAGIPYATPR